MGFYSFYKIIKDIIMTLFGNKFLKIFLIITIFFTIFFILGENGVFAVSDDRTSVEFSPINWNYTFTINNPKNYYIIAFTDVHIWSNGVRDYDVGIILSSSPITVTDKTSSYYTLSSTNGLRIIENYVRSKDGSVPSRNTFNSLASEVNERVSKYNGNSADTTFDLFYSATDYHDIEIFSFQNVYDLNNNLVFGNSMYIPPSLGNTQEQLQNLNFSNFIINANSYTDELENNDGTLFMLFYNRSLSNSSSTEGLYPIKEIGFPKGDIYTDYENSTSDNMVFSYPIFKTGVFFNIGSTYEIRFAKKVYNSEYNIMTYEYLGEPIQFTISSNVTQDYINQLNQQTATSTDNDTTQELQNSIKDQTNAINNQTQSIDNINNSITDSSVDSSSIDLPTDNTQDPTQSGVDNIFQTIYNSFTSGTAQDIIFPIPFTDKSITLQANYIYNMLNNNNASWIITIIQAFWWYLISRFIITDIMKKIRKIKQGNFENLQNSNIKEDML